MIWNAQTSSDCIVCLVLTDTLSWDALGFSPSRREAVRCVRFGQRPRTGKCRFAGVADGCGKVNHAFNGASDLIFLNIRSCLNIFDMISIYTVFNYCCLCIARSSDCLGEFLLSLCRWHPSRDLCHGGRCFRSGWRLPGDHLIGCDHVWADRWLVFEPWLSGWCPPTGGARKRCRRSAKSFLGVTNGPIEAGSSSFVCLNALMGNLESARPMIFTKTLDVLDVEGSSVCSPSRPGFCHLWLQSWPPNGWETFLTTALGWHQGAPRGVDAKAVGC